MSYSETGVHSVPNHPANAPGPLSGDRIFATIEDLVGFAPRATGSLGGARAAEYVAARLRDAGLPDVRIMEEPSYAWHASRCSLDVDGIAVACSPIQHCATGHDSRTGTILADPVAARVVDIGDGDVPDSARGAIVLFDLAFEAPLKDALRVAEHRYDPHGVFRDDEVRESRNPFATSMNRIMAQAAAKGAVAGIGILRDYPESLEYRNEYFSDDPMELPGVWITRSSGQALRERLRADSTATIDMRITRHPVTSQSVIGILPGRTSETLMVQSHHDSETPGAVEDASGTAEVIALAEHFAARAAASGPQERTMMFVTFDTHFTGYHAHQRFTRDHMLAKDREFDIVMNATIEHVGLRARRGRDGGFENTGESEPRAIFENLSLVWKFRLARMLRRHRITGISMLFGTAWEFSEEGIPTDAAYALSAGVPTVSFISGPLYLYDEADTLEMVDRAQLGPVAEFFADLLERADTASAGLMGFIPRPIRRLIPSRSWVGGPSQGEA